MNCPHWRSVFSSVFKEPKLTAATKPAFLPHHQAASLRSRGSENTNGAAAVLKHDPGNFGGISSRRVPIGLASWRDRALRSRGAHRRSRLRHDRVAVDVHDELGRAVAGSEADGPRLVSEVTTWLAMSWVVKFRLETSGARCVGSAQGHTVTKPDPDPLVAVMLRTAVVALAGTPARPVTGSSTVRSTATVGTSAKPPSRVVPKARLSSSRTGAIAR
jgi:hypothetical protein